MSEKDKKFLRNLSFQILNKLSAILDIFGPNGKPGWEMLVSRMPEGSYTALQVGGFRLASMRLGGSPSYDLLTDMGFRGKTVGQLVSYLEAIECEAGLLLVKPQEAPTIVKHPNIERSIGPEGSVIQLECKATGLPFPEYKWFKGKVAVEEIPNEVVGIRESKLTFKKAKPHHNGHYCCRVMNQLDHAFSNWVEVRVSAMPSGPENQDPQPDVQQQQSESGPKITLHPRSTSVAEGGEYLLTCAANGEQPITYQWFKNGQEMVNGQGMQKLLGPLRQSHSGEYFCKVTNVQGTVLSNRAIIQVVGGASSLPGSGCQESVQLTERYISRQVTLHCTASGSSSTIWFKNEGMLSLPPSRECILQKVNHADLGSYSCKSIEGAKVVAQPFSVSVVPPLTPIIEHPIGRDIKFGKCRGKVALLMGNQRYQAAELTRLRQPHNDVSSLAGELTSLGFHCVTLIDSSKEEMEQAFSFFQHLLVRGVYAVFYFAGHGFEENGENYLVPVDAHEGFSLQECVKAQFVLRIMQDRDTALNFLILDMCRKSREDMPESGESRMPQILQNRANTIISYACNAQYEAFESKRLAADNGIFMTHFLKHVGKLQRIEEVLMDVNKAISDAKPESVQEERWQKPSYVSSLATPVSLHDEVAPEDGTFASDNDFNSALSHWNLAHTIPSPIDLTGEFQRDHVQIQLTFNAEFSNVLLIHVNLSYPSSVSDLSVSMSAYGPRQKYIVTDVQNQGSSSPYGSRAVSGSSRSPGFGKPLFLFKMEKLQRVRGKVTLSLGLSYAVSGLQKQMGMIEASIEPPLIAKLYKYFKD
eukprot:m.14122 g.14122  ORF g.14122 m.14122 type:complete len:813 (+) comp25544_c0_seq2:120-2558(+)